MPAPPVPVPAHVGGLVGHDHHVVGARGNGGLAPGAGVGLARRIRLHRADRHLERPPPAAPLRTGHHPKIAHPTSANVAAIAATTMAMSSAELDWGRNGLKPMAGTVHPMWGLSEEAG